MIHFYGAPASSAGRTHWMLEELGVPYEYHRLDVRGGETRRPEYLAINPGGKVPYLIDGDVRLFESVAIDFYLGEKYGREKGLMPESLEQRALVWQWSLWAMTNLQRDALVCMFDMMKPEAQRNAPHVLEARKTVDELLALLDRSLEGREHLLGGGFTLADLHVASVVNLTRFGGATIPERVVAWLTRCTSRPACQRIAARG